MSSRSIARPATRSSNLKLRIFKRFDRRLAAELKTQRKPILMGLVCVAATSILTAFTILPIRWSVQAINDASHLTDQHVLYAHELNLLAKTTSKSRSVVSSVVARVEDERVPGNAVFTKAEEQQIAKELGAPPDKVHEATLAIAQGRTRLVRTPEDAVQFLGWVSLLVVVVFGTKYWFTRGQVYYLSKAATQLANDLRSRMFAKLHRLPISYFNDKPAGAIQSVLTNDVNVYQSAVTMIRDSIDGPIKAVASFAIILSMQWQLAAISLLFIPIMGIAIQRNSRKMKVAQAAVQDDLSNLSAMTQESLLGARVVKAFSAEDTMQGRLGLLINASYKSQMRAVKRLATLRPLVELIGAAGLATALYICGRLALSGGLQVADIAAMIYALDVINQGARSLGSVNNTYAQVQAASDRIHREILDVPEEYVDSPRAHVIENPKGRIEFKDVSFAYPDGTVALRGVSFVIEPGSSLALVGPSGSGKSTIADLLLRFYDPSSGQILFDGEDIRDLKVGWLRSQIGTVPQQTFLFAGSLGENIRMGNADATDKELLVAACAAHVDDFASDFNMVLGEQGMGLSGGEKQRVAIARALVRNPTVLLLDEATSSLDANSEKKVQEALDEVMHTRTTLFIAHRLTTAARANTILVLRKGEVIERGSHHELLRANGAYAGLFRAFSSGVLDENV